MNEIKKLLHEMCGAYLQKQEAQIKSAISDARDAANNETKSSAGDKYETGREMMQQEIDLNLARLNEVNKMKLVYERINPDMKYDTAQNGAILNTDSNNYYIAISAGLLKVDGISYYAISAASPIGIQMIGKKAGDTFILNGKTIMIKSIA